ncbi:FAA hydrolase family protein, partial [bacterium]|nr:FAA hydrolase family protein [bacterium]
MRLVTYRKAGVARVGALVGKKVVDLAEASVAAGPTPIPPCMIGLL